MTVDNPFGMVDYVVVNNRSLNGAMMGPNSHKKPKTSWIEEISNDKTHWVTEDLSRA